MPLAAVEITLFIFWAVLFRVRAGVFVAPLLIYYSRRSSTIALRR